MVIITQKLIWGAVHGENMIVHRTAAMHMPTMIVMTQSCVGQVIRAVVFKNEVYQKSLAAINAMLSNTENMS